MRYRALGNSGLMVSVAGLGCNNFGRRLDVAATRAVVDAAIDSGVTLLDTAETYGGAGRSEEMLGEVLEGRWDESCWPPSSARRAATWVTAPRPAPRGGVPTFVAP